MNKLNFRVAKVGYEPNPLFKYPRNLPCFCGSGIKFKKCHLSKIPSHVKLVDFNKLDKYIQDMISVVTKLKENGVVYKKVEVNENNDKEEKTEEEQSRDT